MKLSSVHAYVLGCDASSSDFSDSIHSHAKPSPTKETSAVSFDALIDAGVVRSYGFQSQCLAFVEVFQ